MNTVPTVGKLNFISYVSRKILFLKMKITFTVSHKALKSFYSAYPL